jgi:hypothetical protein
LELLTDQELAFELTAFPALVADLAREQLMLQATADDLHEYLGNEGIDTSLFDQSWIDEPWEAGPVDASRLVGSPRFRGLVSMLWYKYSNTTAGLDAMREAITRIESLLADT